MSINKVCISGNLTREPEVRKTQGGTSIMSFGVAVNDRRKNAQTGEWEDATNFVDVCVFGKRADGLAKILHKGSKVFIEGKLRYSSWERDGHKKSKLEVVADDVDPASPMKQNASQGGYQQQANNYTNQGQYGPQNGSQGFSGGYQQGYQQPPMDVYSSDMPFSYPTLG